MTRRSLHHLCLGLSLIAVAVAGCDRPPEAVGQDVPEYGDASGRVVATGDMAISRSSHTATLLPDGRVLVVGGMTGNEGSAAGAQLYAPTSGRFTDAAAMAVPRHSHTATLLPGHGVLITGGYDARGTYLQSAELYDLVTDRFRPVAPLTTARAGHQAVLLADGRVLLVGGVGTGWAFLASAEIYDPASATFAATGSMAVPRESHVAVRLADGRVLVVGGHTGRRESIRLYTSAELYDPAAGTFAPAGDMATRRHKHDAVLLADGRVLVTGGADERDSRGIYSSVEVFDPAEGAFRAAGTLEAPRYKHNGTSVLLADGRVLLAGGSNAAEVFNPATGSSVVVGGSQNLAGQFSAVTPLADGRILITGGYAVSPPPTRAAWVYQP